LEGEAAGRARRTCNGNVELELNMPMRDARQWLIFGFICLMPFQDTILQVTPLQRLGSSFSVLPLMLIICLEIARRLIHFDFVFSRNLIVIAVYAALISLFGIMMFGSGSGSLGMGLQAVKLAIDSILVLYVIFGIDYSDSRLVGLAVQIAFFITLAGILANDLNFLGLSGLTNSGLFHQTVVSEDYDHRWRGLTAEPSVLAPLLMGMGLLCAHFSAKGWMRKIYWFLALTLTALGGSKGGIICMLLILLFIFMLRAKTSLLQAVALLILASPIAYLGASFLLPQFGTEALKASNSIATRLTMQIVAGLILIHFPFGIGFGAMFPAIGRFLSQGIDLAQSLVPFPLSFEEVTQYFTEPQYAGAKSLAGNFVIFFGFPFIIGASIACFRLARQLYRLGFIALLACVLFMVFQLCTSVDSLAYYNIYLPFGIAVYEIRRHANSTGNA
jgi:hypothetical protein